MKGLVVMSAWTLLLVGGCTYYGRDEAATAAVSRADLDAATAETACKAAARNLVQMARCEPPRLRR